MILSTLDEPCRNDAGYKCLKPFEYEGKKYWKCTKAGGYDDPWCFDERGDESWDYCTKCAEKEGRNIN